MAMRELQSVKRSRNQSLPMNVNESNNRMEQTSRQSPVINISTRENQLDVNTINDVRICENHQLGQEPFIRDAQCLVCLGWTYDQGWALGRLPDGTEGVYPSEYVEMV